MPAGTRVPTYDGYAFGFRLQRLEWHGGFNSFSVQYGTGAASNFSNPGNGTTIPDPTQYIPKTRQFLLVEQLLFHSAHGVGDRSAKWQPKKHSGT